MDGQRDGGTERGTEGQREGGTDGRTNGISPYSTVMGWIRFHGSAVPAES